MLAEIPAPRHPLSLAIRLNASLTLTGRYEMSLSLLHPGGQFVGMLPPMSFVSFAISLGNVATLLKGSQAICV